ncbi:MAG: CoA transferase [Chloroflexi bacterium]|nr:CoA transferase [Chloroflexota bacterium]MYD48317.1 CoA transferase [Chloroflexota bacterium]
MTQHNHQAGPLAGVKVLDLTQIMAGPMCTLLLADMGADVIKIERPGTGDDTRRMGHRFTGDISGGFLALNRNKRSIALDLRAEAGKAVFKRMAETADIVAENFRPGVMDRLGLGYETLSEINPALVYASISGFGGTGPYRNRGGFDLVAQGMSGLMSVTGFPEGPPAKVGVPITDIGAGSFTAFGILAAYIHAQRTGQGQQVDGSLMEAGIAYTIWESSEYFTTGEIPGPLGSAHRVNAPYQALRTSDGYINIGAASQPTWEQFCRAIGQEALIEDPQYLEPNDRKAREGELAELLEGILAEHTTDYWMEQLESAGVVAGPIYDMAQVYADEQVLARDMKVTLQDDELGELQNIGVPVKLSATPGRIRHRGPALGQHSREVLLEHGYTADQVEELIAAGVVRD